MRSLEALRNPGFGEALGPRAVSSGTAVHPSQGAQVVNRLCSFMRGFLDGLNKVLMSSDFFRGDIFRD